MNEVDDILGASPKNDKYSIKQNSNNVRKNNYNNYKNNWKEEQNKARQEIYDIMNRKTTEIIKSGNDFKKYLDIQSKFYKHSVGNCLVKFPVPALGSIMQSYRLKSKSVKHF